MIHDSRLKIADAKGQIALKKASLWEEATGTVDQKKDYIKSKIEYETGEINLAEADIEYFYNMIDVLKLRLEHGDG